MAEDSGLCFRRISRLMSLAASGLCFRRSFRLMSLAASGAASVSRLQRHQGSGHGLGLDARQLVVGMVQEVSGKVDIALPCPQGSLDALDVRHRHAGAAQGAEGVRVFLLMGAEIEGRGF